MKLTKYQKEAIVRAIMNDVPKVDKFARRKAIIEAVVKAMSPECRKVYRKTPEALAYYYSGDIAYCDSHGTRNIPKGDVTEKKILEILKPYQEEDNEREQARYRLSAAIMSCSTLAALKKTFPEFDKYFPTEERPTKNLPALANVVADLSKLGWPKKAGAKA